MDYGITIEGLDEFRDNLSHVASTMPNYIYRAMNEAVGDVQSSARHEAPWKTGNLKKSIMTEIQNSGLTGIVYQDSLMADYGIYQEEGTRYIKGKYFMKKGMEQNQTKIKDLFEAAIDKMVKDMAK